MIVSVNMSREIYEYYKDYDLSKVVDTLLEMFDFTMLPATQGKREVERRINVSNPAYIAMYRSVGPRSKKVSLGRVLSYGYELDVLSMSRFDELRRTVTDYDNPTYSCLYNAYKHLLEAGKYDKSETLREITHIVYKYMEGSKYVDRI